MIDIIVTTRDRPAWLREALDSISASASEARTDAHLLVVDDASRTDEARAVALAAGADYLRLDVSLGCAGARVAGFEATSAPFFAFFDDDDVMLPRWFRAHLARMKRGFDVVSSSYWLTDVHLKRTKRMTLPVATFSDLLADTVAANDGSLIRRSALGDTVLRPRFEGAMMLDLWLALGARGARFATIDEPLWLYRRHSANYSGEGLRNPDPRHVALRAEAIAAYA